MKLKFFADNLGHFEDNPGCFADSRASFENSPGSFEDSLLSFKNATRGSAGDNSRSFECSPGSVEDNLAVHDRPQSPVSHNKECNLGIFEDSLGFFGTA